jgi:hypothetical protein
MEALRLVAIIRYPTTRKHAAYNPRQLCGTNGSLVIVNEDAQVLQLLESHLIPGTGLGAAWEPIRRWCARGDVLPSTLLLRLKAIPCALHDCEPGMWPRLWTSQRSASRLRGDARCRGCERRCGRKRTSQRSWLFGMCDAPTAATPMSRAHTR